MPAIKDERHARALRDRYNGLDRCGHCFRKERAHDPLQLDSTYTWACYQCFVPNHDLCRCGHPGYDGHDMRNGRHTCLTPGCPCGKVN